MKWLKGPKALTLLSAAGYFFVFALCAKGIFAYVNQYPAYDALLPVSGTVEQVRLGGNGNATFLYLRSPSGVHKYASYYGRVWPGMERIAPGDPVQLLAEYNRLNRDEWLEGESYYLWELHHQGRQLIYYPEVLALMNEQDRALRPYLDSWLILSALILVAVLLYRRFS